MDAGTTLVGLRRPPRLGEETRTTKGAAGARVTSVTSYLALASPGVLGGQCWSERRGRAKGQCR